MAPEEDTAKVSKQKKAQKVRNVKPLLEPGIDNAEALELGNSKFARALGSNDYQTRDKGLQALTRFLTRKDQLDSKDLLKLWKGIFYCFWHSDKVPVQTELAERLASVIQALNDEMAYSYFTTFVITMRREWFGIDHHRLNKFLMLIRKFFHQMLAYLDKNKWRANLVERYASFIQSHVLLPEDDFKAAGVAFHVGDLLVQELVGAASKPVPGDCLATLFTPFGVTLSKTGEQSMLLRIRDGFFDSLMQEIQEPSEGHPLRHLDVQALAAALFDMGASPTTRQRNREALYSLSQLLEKCMRKRQKREAEQERGEDGAAAAQAGQGQQQEGAEEGVESKRSGKKKRAKEQGQQAEQGGPATGAGASSSKAADHSLEEAAPPTTGKKKRKVQIAAGEEAAAVGPSARPTEQQQQQQNSTKGSSKSSNAATPGSSPAPLQELTNGVAGLSAKKQKAKEAKQQQQVEAPSPVATTSAAEAPAQPQANGATPASQTPGGGSSKKRKAVAVQLQQETPASARPSGSGSAAPSPAPASAGSAGKAAASKPPPSNASTPAAAGGPNPSVAAARTTAKKAVRIDLRNNLYFKPGAPLPAPDIRTPPAARSKGSILKKKAEAKALLASAPGRLSKQGRPQGQTGAQQQQGGGSGGKPAAAAAGVPSRLTPKSAPRAKAALFF